MRNLCQTTLLQDSVANRVSHNYGETMQIPKDIEQNYRGLLDHVDTWFRRCLEAGGTAFACRAGCSACCRGLFDITLLDAHLLQRAFASLPHDTRDEIRVKCEVRLQELQGQWPDLRPPYLLNALPEKAWTEMPEDDETPCPLLDMQGLCLVYHARPLPCRLHGLPNIDVSGADFEGTLCTLHQGNPLQLPDKILRWRFHDLFTEEARLMRAFYQHLTGRAIAELDTFIPLALLADYQQVDWQQVLS